MKRYMTLVILVTLFPVTAIAEDTKVAFSVNLLKSDETQLSEQLIFRLKEEVRKSSQLELVHNDDQAVYSIDVSTLAYGDDSADAHQIVWAATLSVKDMQSEAWVLADQTVGYVGRDRLKDQAANLMVWIDKNLSTAVQFRLGSFVRATKCKDDKIKKEDASTL